MRLRQAVLVAAELEPVVAELRDGLGLDEPYADPGVAEFGLRNAVFALCDTFLEVVSPLASGTAAGRHLERRGGDGGYMAIFQLDELENARARLPALGVRVVWQIDLPDMAGTHLHPRDVGGAIVSLDRPEPPESWRWAGPSWTGRTGSGAPVRLTGIDVAVRDPDRVAARWAAVLGLVADGPRLETEGGAVTFVADDHEAGLCAVHLEVAAGDARAAERLDAGGVRFDVGARA